MGFYNKYILPKIINAGCGTKPIRKQREKVLPLCKGIVLEIGCGSGLNFSFYEEKNIDKPVSYTHLTLPTIYSV